MLLKLGSLRPALTGLVLMEFDARLVNEVMRLGGTRPGCDRHSGRLPTPHSARARETRWRPSGGRMSRARTTVRITVPCRCLPLASLCQVILRSFGLLSQGILKFPGHCVPCHPSSCLDRCLLALTSQRYSEFQKATTSRIFAVDHMHQRPYLIDGACKTCFKGVAELLW